MRAACDYLADTSGSAPTCAAARAAVSAPSEVKARLQARQDWRESNTVRRALTAQFAAVSPALFATTVVLELFKNELTRPGEVSPAEIRDIITRANKQATAIADAIQAGASPQSRRIQHQVISHVLEPNLIDVLATTTMHAAAFHTTLSPDSSGSIGLADKGLFLGLLSTPGLAQLILGKHDIIEDRQRLDQVLAIAANAAHTEANQVEKTLRGRLAAAAGHLPRGEEITCKHPLAVQAASAPPGPQEHPACRCPAVASVVLRHMLFCRESARVGSPAVAASMIEKMADACREEVEDAGGMDTLVTDDGTSKALFAKLKDIADGHPGTGRAWARLTGILSKDPTSLMAMVLAPRMSARAWKIGLDSTDNAERPELSMRGPFRGAHAGRTMPDLGFNLGAVPRLSQEAAVAALQDMHIQTTKEFGLGIDNIVVVGLREYLLSFLICENSYSPFAPVVPAESIVDGDADIRTVFRSKAPRGDERYPSFLYYRTDTRAGERWGTMNFQYGKLAAVKTVCTPGAKH